MRGVLILFACIAQAHANDDVEDLLSKLDDAGLDKLADRLVDKLVGLAAQQSSLDQADLDRTTLSALKTGTLMSRSPLLTRPSGALNLRPMHPSSPTAFGPITTYGELKKDQRMSTVSYSKYPPDPRDPAKGIDPWGRKETTWLYPPVMIVFGLFFLLLISGNNAIQALNPVPP